MKLMMSNIFRASQRTGCAGLLCAAGLLSSGIVLAERCDPRPEMNMKKSFVTLNAAARALVCPISTSSGKIRRPSRP